MTQPSHDPAEFPPTPHPSAHSAAATPVTVVDEGLPEDEPLTPELLEDEAIRGDFMLRGAVVLLALLLGFTEIAETQTLVHIKTGEYLLSHGVLPPRTDVFSSTAGDRPWVNLSWLFDIALAGVYAAGGAIGLTVFKALLSAATFWFLVNSEVKGVSTWWTAVCAAMALLVAHVQFTALPDVVTLLGLALLLWLIQRWSAGDARTLWAVPVLFLVWSNLDPRMFVGLSMLVLFAVGESIGHILGRSMLERDEQRRHLWMVTAAALVACLVNPFGWHSLTAPVSLYGVEYPALRAHHGEIQQVLESLGSRRGPEYHELQYHALTEKAFWQQFDLMSSVAFAVLAAAAAIAFALNYRRFAWSHVLMALGAVVLAVITARESAPAAIVLAWVAGWNAQVWYRATFRQAYSVETAEILFSRGGRAVTVLGLLALAFLAVSNRLPMPGDVRVGFGWHPGLETHITGARDALDEMYDDRPFNFTMRQGDVFLWLDKRPFIDHRAAVYHGAGDSNLLALHSRTVRALRPLPDDPQTDQRFVWKKTFDDYDLTHAVPSLAMPNPDYLGTLRLLTNPTFQLVRLDSSAAVFYRRDNPSFRLKDSSESLGEYLKSHPLDLVGNAFRTPPEGDASKSIPYRDWPAANVSFQIIRSRARVPASLQAARHYDQLIQILAEMRSDVRPENALAFAHIVIRKVNEGLLEDPNNADGYRMLGHAYGYLRAIEGQLARINGGLAPDQRRYFEAVQAYGQSLLLRPEQPEIHQRLVDLHASQNKYDLALNSLNILSESLESRRLRESRTRTLKKGELELPRQYVEMRKFLEKSVAETRAAVESRKEQLEEAGEEGAAAELASVAYQRGCTLIALELLAGDSRLDTDPRVMGFKAGLLLEAGRPWEADTLYQRLEQVFGTNPQNTGWRTFASYARLAQGDQERAAELLQTDVDNIELASFAGVATTLPLVGAPRTFPNVHMQAARAHLYQNREQAAELRLQIALSHLEAGRQKEAEAALRALLAHSPESQYRPLARIYLFAVSKELVDPEPPSDWIPITRDLFAPEEAK